MTLTNKYDLPDIFCEAVKAFDTYDAKGSDYTATGLITPVRIANLLEKHGDKVSEDVSDRVWALSGHMGHVLFEQIARKNPERYDAEMRYHATLDDFKISARVDCYDREKFTMWDYKESSIWKFIVGDTREWEQQLNINAFCMNQNNMFPHYLRVLVKLKDWKMREALQRSDYPQCAVHVVNIPMWTPEQQLEFIRKRIAAHENGWENPPVCTLEERWEQPPRFALMKKGNKRAVKLYDSFEQAQKAIPWDRNSYHVETRGGEPTRCLYYCPVNKFCDFYKQLKGTK